MSGIVTSSLFDLSSNTTLVLCEAYGWRERSLGWKTSKLRKAKKGRDIFFLSLCLLAIIQTSMETKGVGFGSQIMCIHNNASTALTTCAADRMCH